MKNYIIAEIGINHNGDIDLAKKLIRTAAKAGCHAVKFQKRTIDEVYSQEELDTFRESPWGTTNREQKEGLEFNIAQYVALEAYTKKLNLDFILFALSPAHSIISSLEAWSINLSGIPNNAGSGINGDLLITTNDHTDGDTYSVVIWALKHYSS